MKHCCETQDVPYMKVVSPDSICWPNSEAFFFEFANLVVPITDRHNDVVEHTTLQAIRERWFLDETAAAKDMISGLVIHWSISTEPQHKDIRDIVTLCDSGLGVSSLLDRVPNGRVPCFSWIIFGPSGTSVPIHQDMFWTSTWNLLLFGRKQWQLWSPGSDPKTDLSQFQFTQQSGDLIWIPEGWWHRVEYLHSSICLSKNLVLSRSSEKVFELAKHELREVAAAIRAIKNLTKGMDSADDRYF